MSNLLINVFIGILIAMLCILLGSAYIYFNQSKNKEPTEVVKAEGDSTHKLCVIGSTNRLNILYNNPINIKRLKVNDWLGSIKGQGKFEEFSHPSFGIRASIKVILANIRATDSVKEFVHRIAMDNLSESKQIHIIRYVVHLRNTLGYMGKIREKDVIKVLKAMIFLEGGTGAVTYFGEYLECKQLENLMN